MLFIFLVHADVLFDQTNRLQTDREKWKMENKIEQAAPTSPLPLSSPYPLDEHTHGLCAKAVCDYAGKFTSQWRATMEM